MQSSTDLPYINSTTLSADNSLVTIEFSEVFNSNSGIGDIEASDFGLSVTGGIANIASSTPASISKVEMFIRLVLLIQEILTVAKL